MISDDRRRQVATTRERHGKDFYKTIGAKSSGKGQTFKDPEKAKAAAQVRWSKEREKRDAAKATETKAV